MHGKGGAYMAKGAFLAGGVSVSLGEGGMRAGETATECY